MRAKALPLGAELTSAAENARSIKEVRELIAKEIRENSSIRLKLFKIQELSNAERFAGSAQTNVYKMKMADGRIVAIKEFLIGFGRKAMSTPERRAKIVKYFIRECGIWRDISSHTNIVELYGLVMNFGEGGLPALVSELYPLGSLRDKIDEDDPRMTIQMRTKLACTIPLLHDACKGLLHLHRHGVVHRDIKGNNIFLKYGDGDLVAALGDFGSAKFEEDDRFKIEQSTSTAATEWAPPEYIIKGRVDYSCPTSEGDIWSFGCTILEVLTGSNPWHNNSTMAALHLEGHLQSHHPDRPDGIGEEHWFIMTCCWQKKPSNRLDAETVLRALEEALEDLLEADQPPSSSNYD